MNEAEAVVVGVSGDTADVDVRRNQCLRCQSGLGCGAGLLTGGSRDIRMTVAVAEELRLAPGDRVAVTLPSGSLTRAVLAAYGLPLTGFIAGAATAAAAGARDPVSVALASAGLLIGMLIGRAIVRRHRCLSTLRPAARLVIVTGRGDKA